MCRQLLALTHHSLCALLPCVFFASCLFSFLEKHTTFSCLKRPVATAFSKVYLAKKLKKFAAISPEKHHITCYSLSRNLHVKLSWFKKKKKSQANTSNSFLMNVFFSIVISCGHQLSCKLKGGRHTDYDFMISRLKRQQTCIKKSAKVSAAQNVWNLGGTGEWWGEVTRSRSCSEPLSEARGR